MTKIWACVRLGIGPFLAGLGPASLGWPATAASLFGAVVLVAGWLTRRTRRTAATAHTVRAWRRRWPTTIPAVEGVFDG